MKGSVRPPQYDLKTVFISFNQCLKQISKTISQTGFTRFSLLLPSFHNIMFIGGFIINKFIREGNVKLELL